MNIPGFEILSVSSRLDTETMVVAILGMCIAVCFFVLIFVALSEGKHGICVSCAALTAGFLVISVIAVIHSTRPMIEAKIADVDTVMQVWEKFTIEKIDGDVFTLVGRTGGWL